VLVDVGTSVPFCAQVGRTFRAETTLEAVAELFARQGLPQFVQIDRDVRCVSSPSGSDFPSALLRFCHCLGVGVLVCDPHQPQHNAFVERYHRT
jgi:transposase